jgi:hypothetical protein
LRLMVVALLISLTLPAVLSSLGDLTTSANDNRLASVALDLSNVIEEMAQAGPGNVRSMELPTDLPAGTSIRLGGENGSIESRRISWTIGDEEIGSRYLNGVSVLTEHGKPIALGPGATLRLICPLEVWGEVRVELA